MNQRRIRAVVKVTTRKIAARRNERKKDAAEREAFRDLLEQAEVCREQAHDAVRLKRWKAATGLFATAVSLCGRAVQTGGEECKEASDALRQMQVEMTTYDELARSMGKPLMAPTSFGEQMEAQIAS